MKGMLGGLRGVGALAFVLAIGPLGAGAQEETGLTWENATELSFVQTGGNTSSSTLGLKSMLAGSRAQNSFKVEVGGIRSETTTSTRSATGTVDDFVLSEVRASQLTAESYFARSRYDRAFNGTFAFSGVGWDRNTFAGVQDRFALVAGLGKTWLQSETARLKTDIGGTYTIQKDVHPDPELDDAFGGIRVSIDARKQLSATTDYTSALIIHENIEETDDLRGNWTHSLSVSISDELILKTSLQLLFDNRPSLLGVPLLDATGAPTGVTVRAPGDKLDNVLTLTLVIKL
jgi:putative salt-induced outer membrane protein YdiY